jgi:hypothetical protein
LNKIKQISSDRNQVHGCLEKECTMSVAQNTKTQQETLKDDGIVHNLDSGNGFAGLCGDTQNESNCSF